MTAQDVADALGVSKSYAYKLVRQLNDEMEALGYTFDVKGDKTHE